MEPNSRNGRIDPERAPKEEEEAAAACLGGGSAGTTGNAASETTALLQQQYEHDQPQYRRPFAATTVCQAAGFRWPTKMLGIAFAVALFCWSIVHRRDRPVVPTVQSSRLDTMMRRSSEEEDDARKNATTKSSHFPADFVWGVATSAYQIEGAVREDGRGETVWDVFVREPGTILDRSTGDVADDHYHRMRQDVALMKSLNIQAYRFSIAFSRILPRGRGGGDNEINAAGIDFYHRLIDELLLNGIEPYITLFHWDLPQALQEDLDGGWLDRRCIDAFVEYARVVFQNFSPKVKFFITLNEPWTYAVNGHGSGVHAPGRNEHPTTEPYIVAHNFLLAHAKVYQLYKEEFASADHGGMIGIANCGDYRYPRSRDNQRDEEAAERAMLFQWGWFVDPLVFGDYPAVIKERVGDRLPTFTAVEQSELRGAFDFLGLNYYSSFLASTPEQEPTWGGYWADIFVDFSDDPEWEHNDMGWNVVSDGMREMLLWIAKRYNNPLVFVTENGTAEPEPDLETAQHDEKRRSYFENHLRSVAQAIQYGVNVAGYFAWSLMDNFEWQFGYQRRFGLCRVNFETLQRIPKSSALWYKETIGDAGRSIDVGSSTNRRTLALRPEYASLNSVPHLPRKLLVGYGSNCDRVRQAVHNGVNCVIWSFLDVVREDPEAHDGVRNSTKAKISTSLNLTAIRDLVDELKRDGFDHVVHLASVGGWNGGHLDPSVSASVWYRTFKEEVGDLFHGLDWDLEGNDVLASPLNYFTLECLDKVGEISQLAKQDGRIVGMAPPESYLDIASSKFSRFVNLTDSEREWHTEFQYFGENVYAYILQKYGAYVDFVSIQFYESFSKAAMSVYHGGMSPAEYLVCYVERLLLSHETLDIDFSTDPEPSVNNLHHNVSFPLDKLVFGLANGWAYSEKGNEKTLYISPEQLVFAWTRLSRQRLLPRGFMFWTIDEEGNRGIFLAKELRKILDSPVSDQI